MNYRFMLAAGSVALTLTASAAAQYALYEPFGESGQFAVSAERLLGFTHVTQSVEGVDDSTSVDSVFLLGNSMGLTTIYNWPRVGFDYFAARGLSLGASLSYGSFSGEGDGDFSVFQLAPRIGYAYMFTPSVGIWPRGGITYDSISVDGGNADDSDSDASYTALSLEAALVVVPAVHTAILIGPMLDIGVSGGDEDTDVTATSIGLQGGLTLWF